MFLRVPDSLHNRIKRKGSIKYRGPFFFKGNAKCKHGNCTKFDFKSRKPPKPGKVVKVRVKVSGNTENITKR